MLPSSEEPGTRAERASKGCRRLATSLSSRSWPKVGNFIHFQAALAPERRMKAVMHRALLGKRCPSVVL